MQEYNSVNLELKEKASKGEISLLHDLPFTQHIIYFVIGFFGSYVFVLVASSLLQIFMKSTDSKFDALAMFVTYLLLTIATVAGLMYETPLHKTILKQFKQKQQLYDGVIFGLALIGGTITINLIMNLFGLLIGIKPDINENEQAIRKFTENLPYISGITTVLLAPICEEVAYRLGVFGGLYRRNRVLAYLAGSLVFGILHTNFNATNLAAEFLNFPSYLFAGAFLCYAFERKGSLSTVIIAHSLNNLVSFISMMTPSAS